MAAWNCCAMSLYFCHINFIWEKTVEKNSKFPQTPLNICTGSIKCCFLQCFLAVFNIESFIINWQLSHSRVSLLLSLMWAWQFYRYEKKITSWRRESAVRLCGFFETRYKMKVSFKMRSTIRFDFLKHFSRDRLQPLLKHLHNVTEGKKIDCLK